MLCLMYRFLSVKMTRSQEKRTTKAARLFHLHRIMKSPEISHLKHRSGASAGASGTDGIRMNTSSFVRLTTT